MACRVAGDEGAAAAARLCAHVFEDQTAPADWPLADLITLLARADPRTDRQVGKVLNDLGRLSAEVEALAPGRCRTIAPAPVVSGPGMADLRRRPGMVG